MIAEGLNLMLYGMGTVFVFLTLLVFCTMAMSNVVAKFSPVDEDKQNKTGSTSSQIPDRKLISIIEAAIAQHRKR